MGPMGPHSSYPSWEYFLHWPQCTGCIPFHSIVHICNYYSLAVHVCPLTTSACECTQPLLTVHSASVMFTESPRTSSPNCKPCLHLCPLEVSQDRFVSLTQLLIVLCNTLLNEVLPDVFWSFKHPDIIPIPNLYPVYSVKSPTLLCRKSFHLPALLN